MTTPRGFIIGVLLGLCSAASAVELPSDGAQLGAYGGIGPSQPLYTHPLFGGWLGVGDATWRLELSGSWQSGFEQRSSVGRFLIDEGLVAPDDPISDRVGWTAEALLRGIAFAGKLSVLQRDAGVVWISVGLGAGARAQVAVDDTTHVAPTTVTSIAADLGLGDHLRLRLDARGYAALRRDQSVELGAELLAGLGVRLW